MHIHILGICGTFMGGIAQIARALGHQVTGSDTGVYPPMSTQLEQAGIKLMEGYDPGHLDPAPDMVVIGNALSRGNPEVEQVLNRGLPFTSGPQWLADNVLRDRWVLAVAGTHGKTTTSAMLAWILEDAHMAPGFLVGGVPRNFGVSARAGHSPFFVIEADEYDTAFFDKRSKFVHYRPRTLILNNLEFDHADIFDDLAQIQRQVHHLVRTVPGDGLIILPGADKALGGVLRMGCWTPVTSIGAGSDWSAELLAPDGSAFTVTLYGEDRGNVVWPLTGLHNVHNALAALAAARHAGIPVETAIDALSRFENVKRRMELRGVVAGITLYDDFAHHPTAIATTLDGLRKQVGKKRILAVLEPRSNTMRLGVHKDELPDSLQKADLAFVYAPSDLGWDATELFAAHPQAQVFDTTQAIVEKLRHEARPGDQILVMSNGGFEGIHERILQSLG